MTSLPPVSVKPFLKLRYFFLMLCCTVFVDSANGQHVRLHEFITETARFYDNQLVSDGTFLYGVRFDGHAKGNGAIFRIGIDGSNYQVISTFEDPLNGANPVGTMVLSGTTLYGMTVLGGENNVGVIFRLQTDGTGFQKLLDFDGNNGAKPFSSLILSGSVLYGLTQQGGVNANGVIFKINTDGTGYQKLFDFKEASGYSPAGALVISNDVLYGVATRGGTGSLGAIFKINVDGTGYETIFDFSETTGSLPYSGLILSGTTLYGTARLGGSGAGTEGSVFKIDIDGGNYTEFASFSGSGPNGTLTLIDNMLYGMTTKGGFAGGVVYAINTVDDTYQEIHTFSGADGKNPSGSLLYTGTKFYGYVPGGTYGYGVIFSMDPDGNNFVKLKDFEATNTGYDNRGSLVLTPARAYGVTANGGKYNQGVIFSLNHDGTGYQSIFDFSGPDGAHPNVSLLMTDDMLYGVTSSGGSDGDGALFKVDTTGQGYEVLHSFAQPGGVSPSGSLVDSGGDMLYGMTSSGGLDHKGVIYAFNKTTKELNTIFDFAGSGADNPRGTMVLSESVLYGLSMGGVAHGVLFSLNTDGTAFTKILDRNPADGGRFGSSLAISGSVIYVSMKQGGQQDLGLLYSVEKDGSNLTKLFDFTYGSGALPEGAIVLSDNVIYGMTSIAGPDESGAAYRINTDGTGYRVLFTFDETPGSSSGRTAAVGQPSSALGSLAIFGETLFASINSHMAETQKGRIIGYNITDEEIVSTIAPVGKENITLFPNPATSRVNIGGLESNSVRLMDAYGRRVAVKKTGERSVDVSALPAGVYYAVVNGKAYRLIKL